MPFPYSATIVVLTSGPPNARRDPAGLWAAVHTALRLDAMTESPDPDRSTLRFTLPSRVRSDLGSYDPMSLVSRCVLHVEPVPIGLEVTLRITLLPLVVLAVQVGVLVPLTRVASPVTGTLLAFAILGAGYFLARWRMRRWLRALTQRDDTPFGPEVQAP